MEEDNVREFLINCGLKPKEIADKLSMKVRTINNWIKGGNIAPYMCQLVELTFSEYDLETGKKIPGIESSGNIPAEIIEEKDKEIEQLKNIIVQKDRTIENLNGMIDLLKSKSASNAS